MKYLFAFGGILILSGLILRLIALNQSEPPCNFCHPCKTVKEFYYSAEVDSIYHRTSDHCRYFLHGREVNCYRDSGYVPLRDEPCDKVFIGYGKCSDLKIKTD